MFRTCIQFSADEMHLLEPTATTRKSEFNNSRICNARNQGRKNDMGRGSSTGKVSDYYKKKGQNHGEGAKRRKLSKQGATNRETANRERKIANPSNG